LARPNAAQFSKINSGSSCRRPAVFSGHLLYPAFQPPSRTFLFFFQAARRLNFRWQVLSFRFTFAESAATGSEYTAFLNRRQLLFSEDVRFFCNDGANVLILIGCRFPFAFALSFVVQ
jgi:hypothetical protein